MKHNGQRSNNNKDSENEKVLWKDAETHKERWSRYGKRGRPIKRQTNVEDTGKAFMKAPIILEKRQSLVDGTEGLKQIQATSDRQHRTVSFSTPLVVGQDQSGGLRKNPQREKDQVERVAQQLLMKLFPPPDSSDFILQPIQLIDEMLGFNAEKFPVGNSECLIVGVVGKVGVGKSTILNGFCSVQGMPFACGGHHRTKGINAFVTSERVVLLDTEAIMSSDYTGRHSELANDSAALKRTVWLLSVCHVVIAVSSKPVDQDLWSFINNANELRLEMLQMHSEASKKTSDVPSDSHHQPTVVYVVNKPSQVLSPQSYSTMIQLFSDSFQQSQLHVSGLFSASTSGQFLKTGSGDSLFNIYCIPESNMADKRLESFVDTTVSLKTAIVTKRTSSQTFSFMLKHLVNNILAMNGDKKQFMIVETEWLRSASRMWDFVRKLDFDSIGPNRLISNRSDPSKRKYK